VPPSAEPPSLRQSPQHWLSRYSLAVGIVAAATLLRLLVDPIIHEQIPYFIYVASVVIATWFCGIDAGILSTILAAFVAAGFQEHVPKPVPPEQLAHVVARFARGDAPGRMN
jgi:K+-sensing histidine kinase KdpD